MATDLLAWDFKAQKPIVWTGCCYEVWLVLANSQRFNARIRVAPSEQLAQLYRANRSAAN